MGWCRGRMGKSRLSSMLALMTVLGAVSSLAQSTESPSPPPAPPGVVREYTDNQGRLCRVYRREIVIDGVRRTAMATVCREPDGRWVLSR